MATDSQIVCSLEAGDIERRVAAIAEVGAEGLIDRGIEVGQSTADALAGAFAVQTAHRNAEPQGSFTPPR
jgi:hypothetical protein